MPTEFMRELIAKHQTSEAERKLRPPRKLRRTDIRRAQLIADGRKALALRKQGMRPTDVLMVIGGSRPRMYKAMDAAERAADPLTEYNERKFGVDPLLL